MNNLPRFYWNVQCIKSLYVFLVYKIRNENYSILVFTIFNIISVYIAIKDLYTPILYLRKA